MSNSRVLRLLAYLIFKKSGVESMKYCSQCGRQVQDEARFCKECGAALPDQEVTVAVI